MVKKWFVAVLILVIILPGCVGLVPDGPALLEGDGKTYQTGFYGDLFPHEFELTDQTSSVEGITLTKLLHPQFQLYHAEIGPYASGTLYCAGEDYENAVAFYSDPSNYTYFCILGANTDTTQEKTVEIPQVDPVKFEALWDFARQSEYDPFDSAHNAKVEKVDLPMPDSTKDIRLVFYKESVDSLFTSIKGNEYYIFNNRLYMVYQYDCGHGEYEKLIAVQVPLELSNYFVDLMKSYV